MKPFKQPLWILAALVTALGASQASADIIVGFSSSGGRNHHHDTRPHRYSGSRHSHYSPRSYWHGHHHRPAYHRRSHYRPVVIAPLVVTHPTYVNPGYSGSGNYGNDLADLKERLSRLRAVVQRQKETGEIAAESHDRYMSTLDGIEKDQHSRAYDRGGNLAPEDFADLFRRLDSVSEDVERDLAG